MGNAVMRALLAVLVVAVCVAGVQSHCQPGWDKATCNSQTRVTASKGTQRLCAYCEGKSTLGDIERCMDINVAIALQEGHTDKAMSAAAGPQDHCHFDGVDASMRIAVPRYCHSYDAESCPEHDDNGRACFSCPLSKRCVNKENLAKFGSAQERESCSPNFCEENGPCTPPQSPKDYCWNRSEEDCTSKGPDSTGNECALCGGRYRKCATLKIDNGVFESFEKLDECPLIRQKYCNGGPDADPRCPCGANGRSDSITKCLDDPSGGGFANVSKDGKRRCAYCARVIADGSKIRECRSMKWVDDYMTRESEGFDTMACVEDRAKISAWWSKLKANGFSIGGSDKVTTPANNDNGGDSDDDDTDPAQPKKMKAGRPAPRGIGDDSGDGPGHWAALAAFVSHVKENKHAGFCEHVATLNSEFITKASDLTGEWVMAWRQAIDACAAESQAGAGAADAAGARALVGGLKLQKEEGFCASS